MILTQIEITNYKQYGGHHLIEIPQQGAIGVIGANGVGKTTLFEAIEWALYSPSSLKAADVRPRVWRGKTEVKVTLDDPANGGRFLVERELGKGSAKAQIYRIDQYGFEEKIVEGATQVTTYVTDHLIGLDHAAFVATFFTRQKELGFFNGSPTARRREVGKLLGLQTIRDAQQIIAEDRKRAQADARSYLAQSESAGKDRDFPAEIASADETITLAKQALTTAIDTAGAASEATSLAEKSLAESDQVREQDSALGQKIMHSTREHDVAKEQSASATRELNRLEELTTERTRMEPIAAQRAPLESEGQQHESSRQKALRKRELEQLISTLQHRDNEAGESIKEEINTSPVPNGNTAWNVNTPAEAADWAASIELGSLEQQTNNISAAIDTNEQLTAETKRLETFHSRVNQLREIEAQLLESGDPAKHMADMQNSLQELNGSTAAANTSATRLRTDLQKTERMLANLRAQHEGEICPTCQRPFTSEETSHAIAIFEREVKSHQQQLQQIDAQINANNSAISTAQAELHQLNEANKKLTETRASMESGKSYVQEQEKKVAELTTHLNQMLEALGRSTAPNPQEREPSQRELIAWRKVVEAGAKISRTLRQRTQIASEREPIQQELQSLTEVSYDEARHREVTEQLQQARQAQATIERIDTDLAKRDQHVTSRDAAAKVMAEAQRHLQEMQQQRSTLAFNVETHQQLQASLRATREREKIATEERHRADVSVRESENRLSIIKSEQDRIGKLALDAEAKQREADDLDLMYKEFTEFERFAAAWYAPRLSEIASDLVAQVTDGKYDRVEFDNNFSIEVFDGDDEKFPYETFSGGERDAIALCARIALSRVIGGASSSPPGFLVLDEVFGSLDLERRQRLLEMLSAITGADDHFRQVFIISHVDDVRTSPILDDIWRVTETENGTSELQPLGVGVDIGEL